MPTGSTLTPPAPTGPTLAPYAPDAGTPVRPRARACELKAVTAEQVQTVARKYLVDTHLTVAVLDPQPIGKGQRRMPRPQGGGDVR